MHIHGNVDLNRQQETKSQIKQEWIDWSIYAKNKISSLLNELKKNWVVEVMHIEYVKSYGPRVDHIVLDLKCIPKAI